MRKPFTVWQVGEKEYKLKLTTANACKVEERLGVNILKIFNIGDGMPLPPLKTMLTIVHGAMLKFHSKIKFEDVQDIFDEYVDNGADQTELLTDVILPLLENSGFIPTTRNEVKITEIQN